MASDHWGRQIVMPRVKEETAARSVPSRTSGDYASVLDKFSTIETSRWIDSFPRGIIGRPLATYPSSYVDSLGTTYVRVTPWDRPIPQYVPVVPDTMFSA